MTYVNNSEPNTTEKIIEDGSLLKFLYPVVFWKHHGIAAIGGLTGGMGGSSTPTEILRTF